MGAVMIPKRVRGVRGMVPSVLRQGVVGGVAWSPGPRSGIMSKRNLVPERYGTTFRLASPVGPCSKSLRRRKCAVSENGADAGGAAQSKRADARRNKETLLDAAAKVFVASGVDAPVRDIA